MDRFCLPKMDKTNMFEASEFSTQFQCDSLKVKYSTEEKKQPTAAAAAAAVENQRSV